MSKRQKNSKKKTSTKNSSNWFRSNCNKLVLVPAVILFAITSVYMLKSSFAATATAPTGTYTYWDWPGQDYTSYEWEVTAGIDQTGPDAYYYAHQFRLGNGDNGYAGMQGDSNGKRAIFSIWEALSATGTEIARPFGGEGVGYQTIINYDWQVGRAYRYQVQKVSSGSDGTWWGASVTDTVTGISSPIGQIKVPVAWGNLNGSSIAWMERYNGPMNSCSDIHHSVASFTNFTANGTELPSRHLNQLASPANCPGSVITDTRGGVRQEMGVGNPVPPIKLASPGTSLSDLTPSYVSNGYGDLKKDLSASDRTITLNSQRYARGLGSHSKADIRYDLNRQYTTFKADVGVDDNVSNYGSVIFQVWADGVKLFDSGKMTGATPTKSVSVDVKGKRNLKLVVRESINGIDFDHADWADARLIK